MKIELIKIKLFSVLICIFMFYSCDPEHKETIDPEVPPIEKPEEPDYSDEPKIPSTNTIINLNNKFMIVGSNNWISVAYGNGIFVAVGAKGYYTTSSNEGTTWATPKQLSITGDFNSVIFANGRFVALGSNGNVAVSTDNGGSWKVSKPFNTEYWRGVAYGNGKFVAVQSGGGLATVSTSTDGETWTTPIKVGSGLMWMGIAFGNGIFIAIADGHYFTTSTDGITWTNPKRISNAERGYDFITFGNGKFVVAEGYRGNTQTTTDGETWTTPNTSAGIHSWQDIAAGNGKFILVGRSGYIATSTDGITWAPTQIKDEAGSPVTLILYGVCATQ